MSICTRVAAMLLFCFAFAPAHAAERTVIGTITGYECGDNCYLTLKTSEGEEINGLCAASTCEPWNEVTEMPKAMIGRSVNATVGMGQQVDGSGNVMGEFPSFSSIEILPE